ncbi:MAG: glycosyl hydrolase, partial [Bacteroidetes bacterium]
HMEHLKKKAHENGLELHIEPHDMNPTSDMVLASVGDVPMAEFWRNHFNSAFSVHQASSTGHIYDKPIVAAEAYTSFMTCWNLYPYQMKNQGDWAFSTGINRFVYVRFTHQPWQNQFPGMAFGPHGIHWDRTQTFWPLLSDYHKYIARCQYMLRQGDFVADICYLLPEGAPNVFVPPPSAFTGDKWTPDRRGYNFDGCPPSALIEMAEVHEGKIVFPSGASYQLLVVPDVETMTPELLEKLESLVRQGATMVGSPPLKSPSLSGYPECDGVVNQLVEKLWGGTEVPADPTSRKYGKGTIHWGGVLSQSDAVNYAKDPSLDIPEEDRDNNYSEGLFGHDGTRPGTPYPDYESTASILKEMEIPKNFSSTGEVRYSQLHQTGRDIYFVANRTDHSITDECRFRTNFSHPQLWDPLTGETRPLPQYHQTDGITSIPMNFEAFQSFFVIFREETGRSGKESDPSENFPSHSTLTELTGSWIVSFDPDWGGPEKIVFDQLEDWTGRPEEGIRYYSGIASYHKTFELDNPPDTDMASRIYLDLGEVHDLAGIILNNKNLGEVWTAPWHIDITDALIEGENDLEIRVANRWPNRLIGDEFMPYDGVSDGELPAWLSGDEKRTSGRYTFTTLSCYTKDSPLLPSGLLGPVRITGTKEN